ncbi:hypothetical protein MRX96_038642 [Rhipicephalus microplus]
MHTFTFGVTGSISTPAAFRCLAGARAADEIQSARDAVKQSSQGQATLILTWPMLAHGAGLQSERRKPTGACFAAFWGVARRVRRSLYAPAASSGSGAWLQCVHPSPTAADGDDDDRRSISATGSLARSSRVRESRSS